MFVQVIPLMHVKYEKVFTLDTIDVSK